MKQQDRINQLEEKKQEIISFTNELDENLRTAEINLIEYQVLMNEQYPGKTKEELMNEINNEISQVQNQHRTSTKTKAELGMAGAILAIVAIIFIFSYFTTNAPTGLTVSTKQVMQTIDYNKTFDHYTETQLEFNNLVSLKISGTLEGTGAKVKLRINGTEYLVAEIINPSQQPNLITSIAVGEPTTETTPQYDITTDKTTYTLGETVNINIIPETENKSIYINYENQTQKIDNNTYSPSAIGEYTAVALIVLPTDILRIETNFTVINETTTEPASLTNETTPLNETNQTTNETTPATTYTFNNLCTETCTIPETTNPILIIEPAENTTLTITTITITQNKENQAPTQNKNIQDITLATGQTTTLNLNDYFTDPEGDLIQYDINEIPEINAQITQNTLTITSQQTGTYTAFIYATDGDKLTTSNTFQIIITQETINQTTNETIPALNESTNITSNETIDLCNNSNINLRPSYCFVGIEDLIFKDLSAELDNTRGGGVGRFTRFGNLVIKGLVIENATGTPNENDFKIGYNEISNYEEVRIYTAWIDSETGNLYLKGRLYQEKENLEPPQFNSYIIRNRFGLILGYFDERTGDLYLKGNIVQLGNI